MYPKEQSEETPKQNQQSERARFLLSNLVKGLIWLAVIVGGYFVLNHYFDFSLEQVLGPFYDKPVIIYSIFFVSEVVFGIIPPEFFMIWSLRHEDLWLYAQNVALLAAISYLAGIIGYNLGSHFSNTKMYRLVRKNYLHKVEKHFNRFGGFLIIVAALTPLPFAGVCMLMGTVKYPFRRFLIFTLVRFARFIVYAMVIWDSLG